MDSHLLVLLLMAETGPMTIAQLLRNAAKVVR